MHVASLTVDLHRAGRDLTIYLAGELDSATAPMVTESVIGRLHPDDEVVWVDLSAVTFCDASGIHAFERLHAYAQGVGARLTLYHPTQEVLRSLTRGGMDRVLTIWSGSRADLRQHPA